MAYTDVWDVTTPLDTQLANQGAVDFRQTKLDVMQRIASFGAGLLANRPTPETTSGTADWTGVTYLATDTKQFFRWSGTAWVDISASTPGGSVVTKVSDLTLPLVSTAGNDVNTIVTPTTFGAGSIIQIAGAFTVNVAAAPVAQIFINGVALFNQAITFNGSAVTWTATIIGFDATHVATYITVNVLGASTAVVYNNITANTIYTPGVGFTVKTRFASGTGSIQGYGIVSYMV